MNNPDPSYGMNEGLTGVPQPQNQESNDQVGQYLRHSRIEMSNLRQEVEGLREQNTWLKILMALLAILIGGSYAWFFFQLNSVESADSATSEAENLQDYQQRIQQLEDELVTLKESMPANLGDRLEQTEEQIQQVQSQVNTLQSQPIPKVEEPSASPSRLSPSTQNGDDASTLPNSAPANPDTDDPATLDTEGLN